MLLIAEELWRFWAPPPFEAVTGPLVPCVAAHWSDPSTLARSLAYHLRLLSSTPDVREHLAGVANHDGLPCPPAWVRSLLTLFCILPFSIPFLYSGTEFGCDVPTNLEFGTLPADVRRPSEDELLLFSPRPVPVNEEALSEFQRFWTDLLTLRNVVASLRSDGDETVQEVAEVGPVVSGRVGPVHFVCNVGTEPVPHAWPSSGGPSPGLIVSPSPFLVDEGGGSIPGRTVVLALDPPPQLEDVLRSLTTLHVVRRQGGVGAAAGGGEET